MLLKSTYKNEDVIILLKDVSDFEELVSNNSHKSSAHYCDYIPEESILEEAYIKIVNNSVELTCKEMAEYIAILTNKIYEKYDNPVFVSLLRAGTSLGVLMKNYSELILNKKVNHYSVALSRGKGIDFNALHYIVNNNLNKTIIFIDGWVGKGTTRKSLIDSCNKYNEIYKTSIKPILAVICDLLGNSDFYATTKDILIPMSLLNAQACGLISRITQNEDVLEKQDYAGAVIFNKLKKQDKTYFMIDKIKSCFKNIDNTYMQKDSEILFDVSPIINEYNIQNINGIKAGINETIRILLKKDISFVIVKDINNKSLEAIIYMCNKKKVKIIENKNLTCEAVAVILNHVGDE